DRLSAAPAPLRHPVSRRAHRASGGPRAPRRTVRRCGGNAPRALRRPLAGDRGTTDRCGTKAKGRRVRARPCRAARRRQAARRRRGAPPGGRPERPAPRRRGRRRRASTGPSRSPADPAPGRHDRARPSWRPRLRASGSRRNDPNGRREPMLIGCPREIKNQEYRVGLTPESVTELVKRGHAVWVESGAGLGIGADDDQYGAAGAEIVDGPEPIFLRCEMVVKVKEPQPDERALLHEGQVLYAYLHLAPDPEQTADLVASGVTAIAYETVTGPGGTLPLLKPMSQVAGRMSIQAGATALEKAHGGRGVLLGGVPGVMPGTVAVIGGGVVGFNAAQMAVGLGADVTILDHDPEVLE